MNARMKENIETKVKKENEKMRKKLINTGMKENIKKRKKKKE